MLRVGVSSRVDIPGINSLSDVRPALKVVTLDEAMRRQWDCDAHFTAYSVVRPDGEPEESWPRINKPALAEILHAGGRVEAAAIVLDYDSNMNVSDEVLIEHGWTPGDKKLPKVPWTAGRLREFVKKLAETRKGLETADLAGPTMVYTTRNGARMVHCLAQPVPVANVEPLVRGLMRAYGDLGVKLDPKCVDWTRLFRLPRVVRDGVPSWDDEHFQFLHFDDWTVPDFITPVKSAGDGLAVYSQIRLLDSSRPDPDQCRELLFHYDERGREKRTAAHMLIQSVLKRGECLCYPVLFERSPMADEGARDATLLSLVGEACARLYGSKGVTPEHVYALFLPVLEQLEPDAGTPNWYESGWSKVIRCWAMEEAKLRAVEEQQLEREEAASDALRAILAKVRLWCKDPAIHDSDELRALRALEGRMIAGTPAGGFHVMTRTGYYDRVGVKGTFLKSRIRELGMEGCIPTHYLTEKGNEVAVPSETIIDAHATYCGKIRGRGGIEGTHIDSSGALVLALYRRDPWVEAHACPDERVDEWLRELVPEEDWPRFQKWLAYSLDFESGPICALSMVSTPGVGKQMLYRGLSECIQGNPVPARGIDLIRDIAPQLLETPFLVVNEGLPRGLPGSMHLADVFRERVAGEPFMARQMYQAPVEVFSPLRVIFMANNTEVIGQLAAARDLTPEDRGALAERLLHIELKDGAKTWLAMRGGKSYTRGWVTGESGEPSDLVVARHFMWMFKRRAVYGPPENRLLVQGNWGSAIVESMRTSSGSAPHVIEMLIALIEQQAQANRTIASGISHQDGRFYVTTSAVIERWRSMLTRSGDLTPKTVANVLRSIGPDDDSSSNRLSDSRTLTLEAVSGEKVKARWWQVDLEVLYRYALEYGIPCKRLEELVSAIEIAKANEKGLS